MTYKRQTRGFRSWIIPKIEQFLHVYQETHSCSGQAPDTKSWPPSPDFRDPKPSSTKKTPPLQRDRPPSPLHPQYGWGSDNPDDMFKSFHLIERDLMCFVRDSHEVHLFRAHVSLEQHLRACVFLAEKRLELFELCSAVGNNAWDLHPRAKRA